MFDVVELTPEDPTPEDPTPGDPTPGDPTPGQRTPEEIAAVWDEVALMDDVPAGLDAIEPGVDLAAVLATIDVAQVSAIETIVLLRAWQKVAMRAQAEMYRAMATIADTYDRELDDIDETRPAAAAEIGAALRLSRRAAEARLAEALDLRNRLPAVFRAMVRGELDDRRAWVFLRHTDHLPVADAQALADRVLEDAPHLTTGQLGQRLRREAVMLDPDDAANRRDAAVDRRRIEAEPTPDGTVRIVGADLPSVRTTEALDRIERLARNLRRSGDTRTMDQLRADVFLDSLCGNSPRDASGTVHLTIDLETLTRLADVPGDLAGYGPIVADVARQTTAQLADGTWSFTVTDADGAVIAGGATRRRPAAAVRRHVVHRDRTCVFPGCRRPAVDCDLDHRTPWVDGGPTCPANLAPLCRHHHGVRHDAGWSYRPLTDGEYEWTSPLGHRYTTGRSP